MCNTRVGAACNRLDQLTTPWAVRTQSDIKPMTSRTVTHWLCIFLTERSVPLFILSTGVWTALTWSSGCRPVRVSVCPASRRWGPALQRSRCSTAASECSAASDAPSPLTSAVHRTHFYMQNVQLNQWYQNMLSTSILTSCHKLFPVDFHPWTFSRSSPYRRRPCGWSRTSSAAGFATDSPPRCDPGVAPFPCIEQTFNCILLVVGRCRSVILPGFRMLCGAALYSDSSMYLRPFFHTLFGFGQPAYGHSCFADGAMPCLTASGPIQKHLGYVSECVTNVLSGGLQQSFGTEWTSNSFWSAQWCRES